VRLSDSDCAGTTPLLDDGPIIGGVLGCGLGIAGGVLEQSGDSGDANTIYGEDADAALEIALLFA
jgi:hypothetical protein